MLSARLLVLWTGSHEHPDLLGLFERTGPWQVASSADLVALGYPQRNRAASAYLVSEINPATSTLANSFTIAHVRLLLPRDYRPVALTWDILAVN
jgi:hypothetical protein